MIDLLSNQTIVSIILILGGGYSALLWGYRDAGKLDYFYTKLTDFDKLIQSLISGSLIIAFGYFITPLFSRITNPDINAQELQTIVIVELLLIIIIGAVIAYAVRRYLK